MSEFLKENHELLQLILLVGLITALLVLFFFSFKYVRKLRKHKQLFGWQVDWAEEQWDIVEKQRLIIEQKQSQIIDSINFARKIQSSILQSKNEFSEVFQKSFILYLPKDIVSGDFYWFHSTENIKLVVVADCTGHGVPGGFLSMIGCTLLNEIVIHNQVLDPSKIALELSKKLSRIIRKADSDDFSDEGMDISIVLCDASSKTIDYFSVNQSIFLIDGGTVNKLSPSIISLQGIFDDELISSTKSANMSYSENSFVCLSTDGFIDQIGGGFNKKLKLKGFERVLSSLVDSNLDSSDTFLNNEFSNWKGENIQTDDVLVLGFRL
jgi:serine phosphatase RsbU (regulator of sigma subunit)